MKLGIGTAQFGMDYGVNNRRGCCPSSEVQSILNSASKLGCHIIDTAPVYGNAEQCLGECFPASHQFKIISKVPADISAREIFASLERSCAHLKQEAIYGLLFHDANMLLGEQADAYWQAILECKNQGLVSNIGVSVYSGKQIDAILARYDIDLIQVPCNIFDQRLLATHLPKLKARGVEIHARSIFLQGLLLRSPSDLPPYFQNYSSSFSDLAGWLNAQGVSALEAAVNFVNQVEEVDHYIIGIDSYSQFRDLLQLPTLDLTLKDYAGFALHDEKILNPSLWDLSL